MNEFIEIRGARENNLKDVSLRIPKRKITIFTGVSGSGKSSIVFDTIATEAQRQLYENFSLFVRNFLPRYPPAGRGRDREPEHGGHRRPEAAGRRLALHGRHDHRHLHAAAPAVLAGRPAARRLLATPSRSTTRRACAPSATGSGKKLGVVSDDFLDLTKSLNEGRGAGAVLRRLGARSPTRPRASSTTTRSWRDFTKEEMDLLLHGKERKFKMKFGDSTINVTYRGHHREGRAQLHHARPQDAVGAHPEGGRAVPTAAAVPAVQGRAAEPGGARLQDQRPQHRRAVGHGGRRADARSCARSTGAVAAPIVATLVERLQHVVDIGLDYLTLEPRDRHALRRRVAARQDGQAPRQQPGRRDVHLRRAERRPAPARRPPPQRAAPEAARQGQHRDRRRARSGRDQGGRPHRRRRPARGHRRRHDRLRGQLRGSAGRRHADRRAPAAGAAAQGRAARGRPASCRSRTRATTTCRTSASTSRPAC